MQGKKDISPRLFYQVTLDDLVAKDNFYRKLNQGLDLQFLYKATAPYYGLEGQESIDPVVFFKICLVGYLNNINSDRKLIEYCSNCLDVRLYLKYDLDEILPWHSTISRTRQLYGEEIFLMLFQQVLRLCVAKGMVKGKRQAIDSAYVKANSSLDSLIEKEIDDDVLTYCEELNSNSEYKIVSKSITPEDKSRNTITAEKLKEVESHHKWKKEAYKDMPGHNAEDRKSYDGDEQIRPKFLSNHTHYSPTDKDARIAVKPGKSRQMNYFAQIAVDDSSHVITGANADFADKRDSECFSHLLSQTIVNLNQHQITIEQVTADTGFSSGPVLNFCNDHNIEAFIPNFGLYKPYREGFIYNQEKDQYECQRGNKTILPYKKTVQKDQNNAMKVYRSNNAKCKNCPLRSTCIGKGDAKKIEHSIHKPLYDAMHEKMQSSYAKRIMKRRSSTVEPVLGTLVNFVNMKRINTRGIKQANKHIMMAALTYNLKKYMKFSVKKVNAKVAELSAQVQNIFKTTFYNIITLLMRKVQFQVHSSC